MANKRYNGLAGKSGGKASGGSQGGTAAPTAMPIKTANWPDLPGKAQPRSRSEGTPIEGKCGPFYVKKSGL